VLIPLNSIKLCSNITPILANRLELTINIMNKKNMKLLKQTLLISLIAISHLSVAKTTQEVVDELMEVAAQDSGVAQGAIIYGNLDIKYNELVEEWNSKYAHTDSSVVNYDEVKMFVDVVKGKYRNAKKYLYLTGKVKSFNDEALYITELYRLLVNRGDVYLRNIKKDNDFRRDITKAMNNALLSYDEDILATLDRMKEMIEDDIESDKLRELEINSK